MRIVKLTLLFALVAAAAQAQIGRHRAIGWPFPAGPCVPGTITVAPGLGDFTLSGPYVYFGDANGDVWRVPKEGGVTPTLLGHVGGGAAIFWIEADATRLYLLALSGELTADFLSMPKDGGAITTVTAGALTPAAMAMDAQFIYWVSAGTFTEEDILADGAVRRVPKSGGAVQTLVDKLSFPIAIAVSGGNVYYGETGIAAGNTSMGLRRIAADGGAVTKLFNGGPVGSIAVDSVNAYIAVFKLGTGLVDIVRLPLAGGSVTPLVSDLDFADGLVLQGSTLYYAAETNERSFIAAIPVSGGEPRPVKTAELFSGRLAFDDCLVYYATGIEAIARAAK